MRRQNNRRRPPRAHPPDGLIRIYPVRHLAFMRRRYFWLVSGFFLFAGVSSTRASDTPAIAWQPWSDSVFAQAKREHKFVLLDLHAVWCHWCHVMDTKTYADPKVIALIQSHYIAVSVDQDSRPDLAQRYQDYGWPATVVYNGDGGEIVKRQGYLPPGEMTAMLQAIIDDPTPGPSVTNANRLSFGNADAIAFPTGLHQQLLDGYDAKLGGWGTNQKFLNWDNVSYCLVRAQIGDTDLEKMARQTLDAQLKLIDPVWGGVDQYSAEGDWDHPHFEKIMQFQAENIRIYAQAYAQFKDPVYLKTAVGIHDYVRAFLTSPDGVVYTSQDADLVDGEHGGDYFKLNDAERRKLGIPRVDEHIYARENGWFIEALTDLFAVTGDAKYRVEAVRAAKWIVAHRMNEDGGFYHGDEKSGPLALGDSLAMGRAFLGLYKITGNSDWLFLAKPTAVFIQANFAFHADGKAIGFATAANATDATHFAPQPDFDENVSLARFANLLSRSSGKLSENFDREIAQTALKFASSSSVAKSRLSSVGSLLLAEQEIASDPLHIAIVGKRDDATAQKLFNAALTYPCVYKQVEWIDPHQKDSIYPDLAQSAAYICASRSCSAPVFDETHLTALLDRKTAPKK
jgi:uncharacterized protein YyaL (SSP411 family)